ELRVQVGTVGIEAVGEAAHRAVHDAVDLHVLDVVVDDQRHHIVEYAKVLQFLVAGGGPAEQAAEHDKRQHRRGNEQDGQTGSCGHRFSHCKGSTGLPSMRNSKYRDGLPDGLRPTSPTVLDGSTWSPRCTVRLPR